MNLIDNEIHRELDDIRAANRWRTTAEADSGLNFSSNDYLGLSRHPAILAAAHAALDDHGAGATASRLMAGQHAPHAELEATIARFWGTEAALVFPSGYQANVGSLTTLANRETHIFSDALNHASLIDGARLSRATIHIYPHCDTATLATLLEKAPPDARKLLVTESIFSMDGVCAPLAHLHTLAERHGAALVVDEAHAVGVFGQGKGMCAREGIVPFVMLGTLSKALGCQGGFVACSAAVRDLMVNRARTFIFTTGLAPACAAAANAALKHIDANPRVGETLLARAALFRDALRARGIDAPGESQIVPILLGDEGRALAASAACRARGVTVHAIRPPTVPPGGCRLRFSITLEHSESDLMAAADAVAAAMDVPV